jgi:hypothetical protein
VGTHRRARRRGGRHGLDQAGHTQKARWVHEGAEEAGRGTGLRYISIFDPGDDQVEYLAKEVVAPLRDG